MQQAFKICPTCGVKNDPSNLSCQCGWMLANVPITPVYISTTRSQTADLPSKESGLRKQKRSVMQSPFVLLAIFFLLVLGTIVAKRIFPKPTITSQLPQGLGTITLSSGEVIGVNDGMYAPVDIGRSAQEMAFKQQAAMELKKGSLQSALTDWQQALGVESNDAEALIYTENQHVLASGKPHITLIVGTAFTPPFPDTSSENDLQGIYVEQHEYNDTSPALPLYILIANSGSNVNDTTAIAQQIVRIASEDKTVIGVIGWRYSGRSLTAIPILSQAKIPLLSPQSTTDGLTHISPYFFRIVPPNKVEAQVATQFAQKSLHVTNPVIFVDTGDTFSENLAQDFKDQFAQSGHSDLHEEPFVTDQTQQKGFSALIQDAEKYHPDALIFTSRSNADAGFFQDALPIVGSLATIPVIAGSGSYAAHPNSKGRWYFAAFAYHGESNTPLAQKFAQEYSTDFNAHDQKPAGYYGYTLADDHAILGYDTTSVALRAIQMIYASGKTTLTPQDLADMLPQITGNNAFQGVSGQIAFDPNTHDPINRAVLILFVSGKRNGEGHIEMVAS